MLQRYTQEKARPPVVMIPPGADRRYRTDFRRTSRPLGVPPLDWLIHTIRRRHPALCIWGAMALIVLVPGRQLGAMIERLL